MKDEEGLFPFFFSVPCVFRILEPYLPFSVIDCIIPRVRYLYLCQFLIRYRGDRDPKSMNKARRDAAGPHFFWCGGWCGTVDT